MIMIDADSGLHRHRHAVRRGRADCGRQDQPEPVPFVGQRRSPTLASDFGDWAAEVEVDMINAVLVAQDFSGTRQDRRVDTVELNGPYALAWIELEHLQGLAIPLHEPARSDHLADVEAFCR